MSEANNDAVDRWQRHRAAVRDPEPDPTTPQLKGRLTYELEVEQDINILAYFQNLDEAGRRRYRDLDAHSLEAWERPAAFLDSQDDEPKAENPLPWVEGAISHEMVEVVSSLLRVRLRTGSTSFIYSGMESEWREEDFETLRANVPWLDQFHTDLEGKAEDELAEDEARVPGPNDMPLEGM